jgi:hypothetical protein
LAGWLANIIVRVMFTETENKCSLSEHTNITARRKCSFRSLASGSGKGSGAQCKTGTRAKKKYIC